MGTLFPSNVICVISQYLTSLIQKFPWNESRFNSLLHCFQIIQLISKILCWTGRRYLPLTTSSIAIGSEKPLFQVALSYIFQNPGFQYHHSALAASRSKYKDSTWRKDGDPFETDYQVGRSGKVFHHDGRFFYARRSVNAGMARKNGQETEVLRLYCLGRSILPIQRLVQVILDSNAASSRQNVLVYTAEQWASSWFWKESNEKPKRGASTVILDQKVFSNFADDFENFWKPERCKWYEARGLTFRRGYLFHGCAYNTICADLD